jgi:mRNA interferase MazF
MTAYKRGDVVLVKFPYSDLVRYKKRTALVVQDETVDTGLSQRVVVQITSNLERTRETRVLVRKDSLIGKTLDPNPAAVAIHSFLAIAALAHITASSSFVKASARSRESGHRSAMW